MSSPSTATPCRFPLIDPATSTDPRAQAVFAEIEREMGFGMVPNIFRALGTQPTILRTSWDLFRSIVLEGRLPRIVKELVGIAVSATHHSEYALRVHMHSLGVQGVAPTVLKAVAAGELEGQDLAPSVVALLRIASIAARDPHAVTDRELAAVKATGVTEEELQEAFAAINLFQYVNSLTDLARVPVDAI
jgi:uncharacterized peroxidase-related enzyme